MKLQVEYVPITEIKPYKRNAKLHPQEQIEQIKNSMQEFGNIDPIGVWHGEIVEGHGRYEALKQMGVKEIPIIRLDDLTDEQRKAYALVHNKLTMNSDFDVALLDTELAEIETIDMTLLGFDEEKETWWEKTAKEAKDHLGNLSKKFIVSPFSVLNAQCKEWLERKKYWRDLIQDLAQARQRDGAFTSSNISNISILDPCLCEIVLKWFTRGGGKCFDVFAGDTVFGYVSSFLGYEFTGIELRKEQADFNNERVQADKLNARYICDDGRNVLNHIEKDSQDFFFSCPPYFDLEVYSDLENDASNQKTYKDFYNILDTAFTNAIQALKENSFSVVVCGDVRDKNGVYYNFPNDIKNTFIRNGMKFYNEIILVDPIGTGAIRANNNMKARKVVKIHQNVLVFYKGNTNKISKVFPAIEFEDENESEN